MTQNPSAFPVEGGCTCRAVRYRMQTPPMIVHCCHCSWCQRETGSAFACNAVIEAERVPLLAGRPELVHTPSASGAGQQIARCPNCRIAVWSHYAQAGPRVNFIRVGTLDAPHACPPDIHIFTSTKQPWVVLPPRARYPSSTSPPRSGPEKLWSAGSKRVGESAPTILTRGG